jgi:ubiquinone/menaquinone biosynthesis C-methylase UbiE
VIGTRLKAQPGIDYLSCDLESKQAMVQMDITDIDLPDNTFDVIICNHVMEHIPADTQAMSELFRVLKPGGWAILQTPISGDTTFEDASIQTPEDRLRQFGQRDHVRIYGRDYQERLSSVGFDVNVDSFVRSLDPEIVVSHGLDPDEDIYYCRKPA